MSRMLRGGVMALVMSLAAVVALAATGGVGHADEGDLRARLEAACARIPTADQRLDAAIARLDAPADQRGSLAWFEAAIDRATTAGRTRIATDLERRLERLTDRRAVLDIRRGQIDRLADLCAERGVNL